MSIVHEDLTKIKDMTDKYVNPPNTPEILEQLKQCRTIGDVKALVDQTFPQWFVTIMPRFCTDYPFLQTNWDNVCKRVPIAKAQIMIVEEVEQGDKYTLIQQFAECFTKAGFCVRRKMEFIPCAKCGNAIPSLMMYEYLNNQAKNQAKNLPKDWSETCSGCI